MPACAETPGETAGRWPALLVIALGAFVGGFDSYALNLALPTLRAAFRVDLAAAQWIVLGYLLAMIALLIPAGCLADTLGARALFLTGLGFILIGSLLAAVAPSLGWLVAGRVAQGAGNAAVIAGGQAAIALLFRSARGRALGWLHAVTATGFLVGPIAGGFLIDALGWRAIFLANLPVVTLALVVGWRLLPARTTTPGPPFDVAGASLLALGLGALVLALTLGGAGGVIRNVGAGALTLGCLVAFVLVERRASAPLIDLSLLRRRPFAMGLAAAALTFVAMAANMFLAPFLLRDLLGLSARAAGGMMAIVPVTILLLAPLGDGLADRGGPRRPATLGLLLVTAAIVLLATARPTAPIWPIVGALVLYGAGAALFQAPNNSGVLTAAPADRLGAASGLLALARQLGQILGVAVAGGVWRVREASGVTPTLAFRDALLVLAMVGLLACVVSWLREPVLFQRRCRRGARQGGPHG